MTISEIYNELYNEINQHSNKLVTREITNEINDNITRRVTEMSIVDQDTSNELQIEYSKLGLNDNHVMNLYTQFVIAMFLENEYNENS